MPDGGKDDATRDIEISLDYVQEIQARIGQSDSTVDETEDDDNVFNNALAYVSSV